MLRVARKEIIIIGKQSLTFRLREVAAVAMERTGKRNSRSGAAAQSTMRKRSSIPTDLPEAWSSNSKNPRLDSSEKDDLSDSILEANSTEVFNDFGRELSGSPFDTDLLSVMINTERIPSPLPLHRVPVGPQQFNTFSTQVGQAAIQQTRRAKEIEELFDAQCPKEVRALDQRAACASSLFEDDDFSEISNPLSMPFDIFDDQSSAKPTPTCNISEATKGNDFSTALTNRIHECAVKEGQGGHHMSIERRGFSIQKAIRLKDQVVELMQMIESPVQSQASERVLPGSIVNTPHGLAMLLIPKQQTYSSDVGETTNHTKHKRWTAEEDELLAYAVHSKVDCGSKLPWLAIAAEYFPETRTGKQCKRRWGIIRSNPSFFREEEDEQILAGRNNGVSFSAISSSIEGRTTEQVRARFEVINPDKTRSEWTKEEECTLIGAQRELGNMWKEISDRLPGRTSQDVKNHWHNSLKFRKP